MTLLDVKEMVLQKLKTLRVCIPNSICTQWVVRCPYCKDSRDPSHGHFSILINMDTDDLIKYRCLKCPEAGIMNPSVMEELGLILSIEEAQALTTLNRSTGKSTYFKSKPKNYMVPPIISPVNVKPKLDYLQRRLGFEFTDREILDCKIVLSILDFFTANKIPFPRHIRPELIQILETNYVGFLSANNNKIIFRRITDNDKLLRYYKLTLDLENSSPNNFYSLVNPAIDLLYTHPIYIHISEGTFDIIGIRYNTNLFDTTSQTHLFYASCGYNFSTILKYLIFKGINTDIHLLLYSDADKSDSENKSVINQKLNKIWIDHVEIHRNQFPGEKDYGVPRDKIQDSFITLK